LISVKPGRRRPLTEADLLKIRDQRGDDRAVNTLLWEIARLRKSVPGQSSYMATYAGHHRSWRSSRWSSHWRRTSDNW